MLTPATATDYVNRFFARFEETVTIISAVAYDLDGDAAYPAVDVTFNQNGRNEVFTVWVETPPPSYGAPYLYGEY